MTEHIQYSPEKDALILLDQRYLPNREDWFECKTTDDICFALVVMVVRGAPAIGVTAAYGCYLAGREVQAMDGDWKANLSAKLDHIHDARPTAVNLRWAVREMRRIWDEAGGVSLGELLDIWLARAKEIHAGDIEMCELIGKFGGELIDDGDTVMTHCNAGALATAGSTPKKRAASGIIEPTTEARVQMERRVRETTSASACPAYRLTGR